MVKRTSFEIKKAILEVLSSKDEISFGELERRVNTNWISVKKQCQELEIFEAIDVNNNKIKIAERGKIFLEKIRNALN